MAGLFDDLIPENQNIFSDLLPLPEATLSDSVARGFRRSQAAGAALGALDYQERAETANDYRNFENMAGGQGMAARALGRDTVPIGNIGDTDLSQSSGDAARIQSLISDHTAKRRGLVQKALGYQGQADALPQHEGVQEFGQLESGWDAAKHLVANPSTAAHLMAESAYPMVEQIGAAAAGGLAGSLVGMPTAGAMAGSGIASRRSNLASKFLEEAQKTGIDLDTFIQDKAAREKALNTAKAYSAPIAVADALSMGAAKYIRPFKSGVGNVALQGLAVQPALGAGGEALGQINAYGEIESMPEVVAEGLLELPMGIAETGLTSLQSKKRPITYEMDAKERTEVARQNKTIDNLDAVVQQMIGAESSGNAKAKNPLSSAEGLGQFIDSTWLSMMKKHRPDLVQSKSRDELLALKFDGDMSREMTKHYAMDNIRGLEKAGYEGNGRNIYLAHHFGIGGAKQLLGANSSQSVADVLGAGVIAANPYLKGKSVGQALNIIAKKMGGQSGVSIDSSTPIAHSPASDSSPLIPDNDSLPDDLVSALDEVQPTIVEDDFKAGGLDDGLDGEFDAELETAMADWDDYQDDVNTPDIAETASTEPEIVANTVDFSESEQITNAQNQPDSTDNTSAIVEDGYSGEKLTGDSTRIRSEDGQWHEAEYEVLDAALLDPTMQQSDNQFRDRERGALEIQVNQIASGLEYDLVKDSPVMDYGAPVLNQSDQVVAGNGRLAGIREAYRTGKADDYKARLAEDAARLGVDNQAVSNMKYPVLVRRFKGSINTSRLAQLSNEGGAARMSPLEQARVDSERIGSLHDLEIDETGNIKLGSARTLLKRLLKDTPINQHNALQDNQGGVSQEGLRRIQNAVLHQAYGDSPALSRLVEAVDNDSRNILRALNGAAPALAELRRDVKDGAAHDLDIVPELVDAVEIFTRLRREGTNIKEWLDQLDAFHETPAEIKQLLLLFDEKVRKPKTLRDFLQNYAQIAKAQGNPSQGGLFEQAAPNKNEVIDHAIAEANRAEQQRNQPETTNERPESHDQTHQEAGSNTRKTGEDKTSTEVSDEQLITDSYIQSLPPRDDMVDGAGLHPEDEVVAKEANKIIGELRGDDEHSPNIDTVGQLAQWLLARAPDDRYRYIAKKIIEATHKSNAHAKRTLADIPVTYHKSSWKAAASVNANNDSMRTINSLDIKKYAGVRVALRKEVSEYSITYRDVLHEMVHVVTLNALKTNNLYKQEAKRILKEAQKYSSKTTHYGLTNIDEMVAEGLSNSKFQHFLSKHRDKKHKNLFQRFVNLVKNAIGIKNTEASLLDSVNDLFMQIITDGLQQHSNTSTSSSKNEVVTVQYDSKLPSPVDKYPDAQTALSHPVSSMRILRDALSQVAQLQKRKLSEWEIKDIGLHLQTFQTLVDRNKHLFRRMKKNPLVELERNKQLMTAITTQWAGRFEQSHDMLMRLSHEQRDGLSKLMLDATLHNVHPDQAYQPSINTKWAKSRIKAFEGELRGIDADERKARHNQTMANQERQRKTRKAKAGIELLNKKIKSERKRREFYPELTKRWNSMSNEQRKVYTHWRDELDKLWNKQTEALEKRIAAIAQENNLEQNVVAAARESIQSLRLQYRKQLKIGPYFPLKRYGNYVVQVRSLGEYARYHFESEYEANQFHDDYLQQNPKAKVLVSTKAESLAQPKDAPSMAGKILKVLNESGDINDDQKRMLNEFVINQLPDLSSRKSEMRRHFVDGASADMERGFANAMLHGGHDLARIMFGHEVQKQISVIDEQLKLEEDLVAGKYDDKPEAKRAAEESILIDSSDRVQSGRILKVMRKQVDAMMSPDTSAAAAFAGNFAFVWLLAASPMAGLINLLQTQQITLPMLAGRFGALKAQKELNKALIDVMRAYKTPRNEDGKFDIRQGIFATSSAKHLEPEERQLLQAFELEGVTETTQANSLARTASGDGKAQMGKFALKASKAMAYGGFYFHNAEIMNRQITQLAAYRLYQASDNKTKAKINRLGNTDYAGARGFARWMTNRSHYDYGHANRSLFIKGNTAKILLPMKNYSIMTTELLLTRMKDVINQEADPDVRKLAAKELLYIMGTTALLAGAAGIGGYWTYTGMAAVAAGSKFGAKGAGTVALMAVTASVLGELLSDDDEPMDAEAAWTMFLRDTFGDGTERLINRGVVNATTGFDLSSRISMANLLYQDGWVNNEGGDHANHILEQIAGVNYSLSKSFFQGAELMGRGELQKGFEKFVPKFVRDISKAQRYMTDGLTNTKNDELLPSSEFAPHEIVGTALGISPDQVTGTYDDRKRVESIKVQLQRRRNDLMNKMRRAVIDGDGNTIEIQTEIDRFNIKNPHIKITRDMVKRSVKAMERNRLKREAQHGLYMSDNYEQQIREHGY